MRPRLGGAAMAVLCAVAALCATVAWTATVYLESWADGGAGARVARAVIDDPEARGEVLAPVVDHLVDEATEAAAAGGLDVDPAVVAEIRADVMGLLDDPAVRTAFAEALAGAEDEIGIDPSAARDVLVAELADSNPELAATLAEGTLPDLRIPEPEWLSSVDDLARRSQWIPALLAVGLFAVAYVLGSRMAVARRYAYWAVLTAALWIVAPWLIAEAAAWYTPSADAAARVMTDAYVAPVRPWAIGLAISALVAVVVTFVLDRTLWLGRHSRAGSVSEGMVAATAPQGVRSDWAAGPVRTQAYAARSTVTESPPPPAATPVPARSAGTPVDRFEPSGVVPGPVPPGRAAPPAADDGIDVWAAYGGAAAPPRP